MAKKVTQTENPNIILEEEFVPEGELTQPTPPPQSSEDVAKDPDLVKWDFGHLTFQCYKCGHLAIIQHDIEDGIMLTLPTTNKHEWRLTCPRCKNTMRLYWQESPKKKEVKPDESKAESKQE